MLRAIARRVIRSGLPKNARLNRVRAVASEKLARIDGIHFDLLDLDQQQHVAWLEQFLPDHGFASPLFKKPIEFHATYQILRPGAEDTFLDAAGGVYTYLHRLPARKKYMQDLQISAQLRDRLGDVVECLESDAGAIPLPDASVDKISCHHSFEHFEGDADSAFIREVQRLLRPGGRACILPLFIAERFFEVTSEFSRAKRFDASSHRLIDPTATLPGGNHYARIYDIAALKRRVLDQIDRARFRITILELRMNGETVPNLALACNRNVAAVNRPFRALVLDRER